MTVDQCLDTMAAVYFHDWVNRHSEVFPSGQAVSYSQLPESERMMRREAMRAVIAVAAQSFDDEVLSAAITTGEITGHQAVVLSERFNAWLEI